MWRRASLGLEPPVNAAQRLCPQIVGSPVSGASIDKQNERRHNEFDSFGATGRTLRQFIGACTDLELLVGDILLPNPGQS